LTEGAADFNPVRVRGTLHAAEDSDKRACRLLIGVSTNFTGFFHDVSGYLEASSRHTVLERMASLLGEDGLLLLDPAEHPDRAGRWFTPVAAGVHSHRSESDQAGTPTFHIQGMNL
jgi:hypothetical protein